MNKMDLSHRKAFELQQRSIDGSLSTGERAKLERHLAICAKCRTDATLIRRLKVEALEHRPTALPSKTEIERTILETQKHYRRWRMLNRLFISPIRVVAWASVAVAFVLALIWLFDIAPQRNQTGSVAVTRIVKEPMVEQVEVTRVIKETVVEQVEVTRVVNEGYTFDAEAEKRAVVAAMDEMTDALAEADHETFLSRVHPDWTSFDSYVANQNLRTRRDIPDPRAGVLEWNFTDYDVVVTPELAVVKGHVTVHIPQNPEFFVYQTAVFKKEDGEWLMIHGHVSEIQ
jgi:ketosteroid isomerase-like protein